MADLPRRQVRTTANPRGAVMSPQVIGLVIVLALLLIVGVMVGVEARLRARGVRRRYAALRRHYGITEERDRG